jgi:hypothetical protein
MTNKTTFSPASEKGHFDGLVDEGRYLRQSSLYKQILPRTPSRPKTLCSLWLYSSCSSCASWLKNPFNQCNPRLIKDLRLCNGLYICRVSSTDDERSLQIHPFLTNKANFRKSQMNVSNLITRNYDKMDTWSGGKNKANTKPIQSQYKPNTNPIQTQFKANTNPNKANFKGPK